jgi:hypothetical protein
MEPWGPYDAATIMFCFAAIGLHGLLFVSGSALAVSTQQLVELSSEPTNPLIAFHFMSGLSAMCQSIASVFVFVRCFKYAETIPGVGEHLKDAAAKAAAAAKRMVSAAIIFVILTVGYASAACAAFGASLAKWSTVWEAIRTLLTILFGRFNRVLRVFDRFLICCQGGVGNVWRFIEPRWRRLLRKFSCRLISHHHHHHRQQHVARSVH